MSATSRVVFSAHLTRYAENGVPVYDGFHQAACTAELLAGRCCPVGIATNGTVVGQDLGITLDIETRNVKAGRKGIGQLVDVIPTGVTDAGGAVTVTLQPQSAVTVSECLNARAEMCS